MGRLERLLHCLWNRDADKNPKICGAAKFLLLSGSDADKPVRTEDRVRPIHRCTQASSKDDNKQQHQQALGNNIAAEIAEEANWKETAWCTEASWEAEEDASQ